MKRLLSKENSNPLTSPTSPTSLKYSNRNQKSTASSLSGETISLNSDVIDYPLENRKQKKSRAKKYSDVKKSAAMKSPRRLIPASKTMFSMLSASSLDLQKLSPKFKKEKEENTIITKLRKIAHTLVENDDIEGLKNLLSDEENAKSPETISLIKKEGWTLESKIFNDTKTNMTLLHAALEYGKENVARYIIDKFSFEYLLQTYTNIDCQIPPSCKSCLHILVEQGNENLLEQFLIRLRTCFPKSSVTYQAIVSPFLKNDKTDKVYDYINMKVVVKIIEGKRRLTPIHLAVINGHDKLLKLMHDYGIDIDVTDDYNETPLMWAVTKKNLTAFKELLNLGADVNKMNQYNCTALHLAVTSNQLEMAEILIDDPNTDLNVERIKNPRWVIENVAFHNYHQIMKKMLSPNIKPRINPININEALFIAAKNGCKETVIEILSEDISLVSITDDLGNTPVLVAAENDKVEVVKLLTETYLADIAVKNNLLQTIYDMAMTQSTPDMLKYLMQHGKSDTLVQPFYLHSAAAAGELEKMNFILDYDKVKLLELDSNNNTIFHTAASYNAHNVLSHFLKKDDDFTDLQNKDGETSLHIAIRKGNIESFDVLMEKNARLDLEDNLLQIPLHASVSAVTVNPEIVEKLIEKMKQTCSPILNNQDREGNTALHLAAISARSNLIEILSDLDPELENSDGETPLHSAVRFGTIREVAIILDLFYHDKKTNIDHKDENGHSALFRSAEHGDAEKFELLLIHGADMTLRNDKGWTMLHKMIENNRTNLAHSDIYIGVFYKIVKWSVKWYCRKKGLHCPIENTNQHYLYQMEAVRYLTNDLYYDGCNVLQYAAKLGTGDLLKAILRTPNVYKFTIESPLKLNKVNSQQEAKDSISLAKFLQKKTNPSEVLCDVTYLIPRNKPVESAPTALELHSKIGNKLTHQAYSSRPPGNMISCLEYIVQTNDENYINDVLDDEPFKYLVSKYWTLCRRGYEVLMWIHVLYMILFTYFIMPTKEYMHYRFNQPINTTENGGELDEGAHFTYTLLFYGLFLVWPLFILLYEIILGMSFMANLKRSGIRWNKGLFGKLKIGEITSGLMRLPVGIMLFVFDNLSHISSLTFGFSSIGWFVMSVYTDDPHNYLECLAVVLIFGWLHTINYVKGFKDWNALASILKQIIIKDITCFIYIFIFVLISFGYAMHVLIQADYHLSTDSHYSTSTIYLTFYRMLSPGNILDISESSDYKNSGGRVFVLRAVCAAYSVLSTVVLMNLLIAMMNSTYSDIKSNKSTAWRIDSLKLALWVERQLPFFVMKHIIKFKTWYDSEQNRWVLVKITEIDKDADFWNQSADGTETEKEKEKISLEESQARDNLKKSEFVKAMTGGLESLNSQLSDVRKEMDDYLTDSRLIKNMVAEMKMEMKRIHELCLETCTLAKMNRRLEESSDKK